VSFDYHGEARLEVKIRTFIGLAGFGIETGNSDCQLSAASKDSFVGTQPTAANEIGDKTNLLELTGEAQYWPQLAPRSRAREAVNQVGETVDFYERQRIGGSVAFHCDAPWALKGKETNDKQTDC